MFVCYSCDFGQWSFRVNHERRRAFRRPMRRAGWVEAEMRDGRSPCVVWGLSRSGARLAIAAKLADLPAKFSLLLMDDNVRREFQIGWPRDDLLVSSSSNSLWSAADYLRIPLKLTQTLVRRTEVIQVLLLECFALRCAAGSQLRVECTKCEREGRYRVRAQGADFVAKVFLHW